MEEPRWRDLGGGIYVEGSRWRDLKIEVLKGLA